MSEGFLFATDLHLRDRDHLFLRGLPEHAVRALNACVEMANEEGVPLVLGGDTLDNPRPSAKVVGQLQQAVRSCRAGVWFIDGNHDLSRPSWLDLLGARRLSPRGVDVNGVSVAGFSFDQLNWGAVQDAEVVVVHADWGEVAKFEWNVPLVLCGHNHFYRNTNRQGTVILNPGPPLLHRFGDSSFGKVVRVYPGRYEEREIPHRKVWQWQVHSLSQLRSLVSQTGPEWERLRTEEPPELLPAVVYIVVSGNAARAVSEEVRTLSAAYPESVLRFSVKEDVAGGEEAIPLRTGEDVAIWRDTETEVWQRVSAAFGEDNSLAVRLVNALRSSDYEQQVGRSFDEWLETV